MEIIGFLAIAVVGYFLYKFQIKKKKTPQQPREVNDFFASKRAAIKQKIISIERPLFIDNDTTGLIQGKYTPSDDLAKVPRTVQLAWRLYNGTTLVEAKSYIIKPDRYHIPSVASDINGITTEIATEQGVPIQRVLSELSQALAKTDCVISHYSYFRHTIIGADYVRLGYDNPLTKLRSLDMMEEVGLLLSLQSNALNKVINAILPSENFASNHNAGDDIAAIAKAFFQLKKNLLPKGR